MKKAITLVLALVLALSLAACGSNDNGGSTTTPPTSSNTSTPPASQGGNDTTPSDNGGNTVDDAAGWPDNEFTQQVPVLNDSFDPLNFTNAVLCCIAAEDLDSAARYLDAGLLIAPEDEGLKTLYQGFESLGGDGQ